MNIKTLLKNSKLRFKTTAELAEEFGTVWMDNIPYLDPLDALTTVSYFAGKPIFKDMVKGCIGIGLFRYGPTECMAHISLLTTKAFPKYSAHGDILKPGMIVTVINMGGLPQPRITMPAFMRNAPGTVVRVLKVNDSLSLLMPHFKLFGVERGEDLYNVINRNVVAVESRVSASIEFNEERITIMPGWFKDDRICAFETSWRLRLATQTERKDYYKQIREDITYVDITSGAVRS